MDLGGSAACCWGKQLMSTRPGSSSCAGTSSIHQFLKPGWSDAQLPWQQRMRRTTATRQRRGRRRPVWGGTAGRGGGTARRC